MNLISNCCATGYLYEELLKQEFPNPFIWSAMVPNDVITMITNWDNIDFENISVAESFVHKRKERNFKIIIDNMIDVHYTHYILSETDDVPRVNGCNVYYKDIINFTINKYRTRLSRPTFKTEPTFLILDNKIDLTFTQEDISKLTACNEKKIILVTDKKLDNIPTNFLYINDSGFDHERIVKVYKDRILQFAQ